VRQCLYACFHAAFVEVKIGRMVGRLFVDPALWASHQQTKTDRGKKLALLLNISRKGRKGFLLEGP
jgi:hypothetical protein